MDDYRYPINIVATWLLRPEYQFELPAHRQLDPYPDRYSRDPRHIEPASHYIIIWRFNGQYSRQIHFDYTGICSLCVIRQG
jgi:hypothetical protein